MKLALNPLRLAAMFSPIWLFFVPSLYLYWDSWMRDPVALAGVGGLPIWAFLVGWLVKGRWALEVTPIGLVHHTLTGQQLFEWARMGPVRLERRGPNVFFSALVFAFPVETVPRLGFSAGDNGPAELIAKHIGRSILAIFGKGSPAELAAYVESQRAAHAQKG